MDTNLTGAFLCSQAAYPHMVRAGGGKIINIGSMMSVFASSYAAPYAASKGGIVQMARALAVAWAKDNIQVNTILPGWIDTELTRTAREQVPGLHDRVLAARRRSAGASRTISPASRCFWRARRPISSPARPSPSTAAIRCRLRRGRKSSAIKVPV